jgi:hypothetical protein
MPSACGGDDLVRVGSPAEGLGIGIVISDVSVDGGLQIDDAAEGAAFEASLGERGEKAFDRIQP